MTTCPKCHRDTQSMAYHTCQITEERVRQLANEEIVKACFDSEEGHFREFTPMEKAIMYRQEERVRSLIAEALTDKEEHIRKVCRQEIRAYQPYTAVSGAESHGFDASFVLDQARDEALEEAAREIETITLYGNGQEYAKCIRALKKTSKPSSEVRFDKNEQPFGVDSRYNRCDCCGEMVDPMDSSWRHAGDHWQHRCKGVDAQAGHPGTATKANPSTATIFRPGDTFSTDGVAKISKLSDLKDAGPCLKNWEDFLWNTPSDDAGVAQRQSACSSPAASTDSQQVAALRAVLFDLHYVSGTRDDARHTYTVDPELVKQAWYAVNGEVVDAKSPDWCWSTLDQKWFRREETCPGPLSRHDEPGESNAASPLREFVEAADNMRNHHSNEWPQAKRYDTARSRVDVSAIESLEKNLYEEMAAHNDEFKRNRKYADWIRELDGNVKELRRLLDQEKDSHDKAIRAVAGYAEKVTGFEAELEKLTALLDQSAYGNPTMPIVDRVRMMKEAVDRYAVDLEKANKALDEVAAWFGSGIDYTEGGFIQTWLESVGRLGGAK